MCCTIDTCMEQWSMCNVVTVADGLCKVWATSHCSLHCEVSTLWHSSASDPSTPATWPPIGGQGWVMWPTTGQCCVHVTNHRSASLAALHLGNIYLASIHCKKCCKPTVCQTAQHIGVRSKWFSFPFHFKSQNWIVSLKCKNKFYHSTHGLWAVHNLTKNLVLFLSI